MKRPLKRLGIAALALLLLIVLLAVAATRPPVVRAIVLPRIADALGMPVEVAEMHISPLSRVELRGVTLGPEQEPLLTGGLLRVRYSLVKLLTGRTVIHEVRVHEATLHVRRRADGTLNLPTLQDADDEEEDEEDEEDEREALLVKDIQVTDTIVAFTQEEGPDQKPISLRLKDLQMTLPRWGSDCESDVSIHAQAEKLTIGPLAECRGSIALEGRIQHDVFMKMTALTGSVTFTAAGGSVGDTPLAGHTAELNVDIDRNDDGWSIQTIAVRQRGAGGPDASVSLHGTAARRPAQLDLEISADVPGETLADIVDASMDGVVAQDTEAAYRGRVTMRSPARMRRKLARNLDQPWTVESQGELRMQGLRLPNGASGPGTFDDLECVVKYDVRWDTDEGRVTVNDLLARGRAKDMDRLKVTLSQPVQLRLKNGGTDGQNNEAVISAVADRIPASLFNRFFGESSDVRLGNGTLDGRAELVARDMGRQISFTGTIDGTDLVLAGNNGDTGTTFSTKADVEGRVKPGISVQGQSEMNLKIGDGSSLTLNVDAAFGQSSGGRATLAVTGITPAVTDVLPPGMRPSQPVKGGRAAGHVEIQMPADLWPLSVTVELEAQEVLLGGRKEEVVAGSAVLTGTCSQREARLTAGRLTLKQEEHTVADMTVDGDLVLQPQTVSGPVTLAATVLDLNRLRSLAGLGAGDSEAGESRDVADDQGASSDQKRENASVDVALTLNLEGLLWKDSRFGLKGNVEVASTRMETTDLQVILPEGDVIRIGGLLTAADRTWEGRMTTEAPGKGVAAILRRAGKMPAAMQLDECALESTLRGQVTLGTGHHKAGFDLSIEEMVVKALADDASTLAEVAAEGTYRSDGDMRFEAHVNTNLAELAQRVTPGSELDKRLHTASLQGALTVTRNPGSDPVLTAELVAERLQLIDSNQKRCEPGRISLNTEARLADAALDLDSLSVTVSSREETAAALSASGNIAIPPTGGRTVVTVSGDALNVEGLLAMIQSPAIPSEKTGQRTRTANQEGKAPMARGPWDLGTTDAEITFDVNNVSYRDLVGQLAGTLRLKDSILRLDPLNGRLEDAPLDATLEVDLNTPGLAYRGEATLDDVPVTPGLNSFAPDVAGAIRGRVTETSLTFSGKGMSRETIQKYLQGKASVTAKDLVFEDLPGQAELARKWAVPELKRILVDEAVLNVVARNGVAEVQVFRETAEQHLVEAEGTIGLDGKLSLDVTFGVAGALRERLVVHPAFRDLATYFRTQGGYLVSPVPIPLEGTVGDPSFDKKRFLQALGAFSVNTVVQDFIRKELGKQTQEKSNGTETAEDAETTAAETVDPADALLEILGGITPEDDTRNEDKPIPENDATKEEGADEKATPRQTDENKNGASQDAELTEDEKQHRRNEERRRRRNEAATELLRSILER